MTGIKVGGLRAALAARALFDDGRPPLACQISLSITGGRLVLDAPSALPRHFLLEVPAHNKVHRVELRWTSRDAAGVKFLADVAAATEGASQADLLREIAALQQRNAELQAQLAALGLPLGERAASGAAREHLCAQH